MGSVGSSPAISQSIKIQESADIPWMCFITSTVSNGPAGCRDSDSSAITTGIVKERPCWLRRQKMSLTATGKEPAHTRITGRLRDQSGPVVPLSKGLAPVLVNKLKYGPANPNNPNAAVTGDDWNRHPRDVRNLTELICSMPKWPKLLTTQELDLARAVKTGGVNSLLQAPVLFITGPGRLSISAGRNQN